MCRPLDHGNTQQVVFIIIYILKERLDDADKAPAPPELRVWGLHRKWVGRRMNKGVPGGEEEQKHGELCVCHLGKGAWFGRARM